MIGLDVGFGWTKVAKDGQEVGKFPTWIGFWDESMEDVEPIEWEGRLYVVGEVVRYNRQRLEVADLDTLIRFLPVFVRYVRKTYNLEEEDICGGLAPKHYTQYKADERIRRKLGEVYKLVVPQGVGVLSDVNGEINRGELVLVLDIGFNTVDFVLAKKREDGSYEKYGIGTLEGLGVQRAIELFTNKLPTQLELLRNFSLSRLVESFERGYALIEGEKISLKSYIEFAIDEYADLLMTRLKAQLKDRIEERDRLFLAGGGANLLPESIFGKDARKVQKPEFSNARGFSKISP